MIEDKDQYSEYSSSVRHYSGLRFVLYSAWLIFMGIAIREISETRGSGDPTIIALGGAVFTATALFIELRIHAYLEIFKKCLKKLEDRCETKAWESTDSSIVSTHSAVSICYILGLAILVTFAFVS